MADSEKVIKAVEDAFDLVHSDFIGTDDFNETEWEQNKADALSLLKERKEQIDYVTCAKSLALMWRKFVLSDSEYNRIMDNLNWSHEEGRL